MKNKSSKLERRSLAGSAGVVLGCMLLSCTGSIIDGTRGGSPEGSGESVPAEPGSLVPAPVHLRRLTNDEYDRTVTTLLGAAPGTSDRFGFRVDPVDPEGYDNLVLALGVSEDRVFEYKQAAESLAAEVMASSARRQQVVGCDLDTGGADCLDSFIRKFGRRAFRSPLDQADVERLKGIAKLAPSSAGKFGGATLVLEAMLQSSRFLFRVEIGAPDAQKPEDLRLSNYEIATRLSYFLWGTTPDDSLLNEAETSGLDTSEEVAQLASKMLADPRAKAGMRRFASAWFRHTTLDQRPNGDPLWTKQAEADAREETLRLFDRHVWEQGVDFFGLLSSSDTEVTAALAPLYGLSVSGQGWQRVTFDAKNARAGLLTQASFLGLTGGGGQMLTPVLRGQFVREALLCQPVGRPPPDAVMAAMEVPTDPKQTVRQKWDATLAGNASCQSCHNRMNPIGFGLERLDRVGRTVDKGIQGEVLTGEGRLNLGGVDHAFKDAAGLSQLLVQRSEFFAECVVKQLYRFGHGTQSLTQNGAERTQIAEHLRQSRDFKSALVAFVSIDSFRFGQLAQK